MMGMQLGGSMELFGRRRRNGPLTSTPERPQVVEDKLRDGDVGAAGVISRYEQQVWAWWATDVHFSMTAGYRGRAGRR